MKQLKTKLPEIQLSYRRGTEPNVKIKSAEDAYKVFATLYDANTIDYKECSYALFLNRANNTIGWLKLSQGGTCATIMDAKVLFATALKCGASGVIISHNHPSGQPPASKQLLLRAFSETSEMDFYSCNAATKNSQNTSLVRAVSEQIPASHQLLLLTRFASVIAPQSVLLLRRN